MRVTRPAPLGKGGFLLFMGVPLVSEELALVEQKVFLGRSSVVSKRWWLQGQVLQSCEFLMYLNNASKT